MHAIQALIFDVDGVLLDSREANIVFYRQFLARGRLQHDVAFERFITRHFQGLLDFARPPQPVIPLYLPRGRREKVRELERTVAELEQRSGTAPLPEEIAEALGVPLEEIDAITGYDPGGDPKDPFTGLQGPQDDDPGELLATKLIGVPTADRLFYVADAIRAGVVASRGSAIWPRTIARRSSWRWSSFTTTPGPR